MKSAIASTSRGHSGCAATSALRMLDASRRNPPRRKSSVHDASALPDLHVLAPGLLLHVIAQIQIRQEHHRPLRRNRIHDLHRIARSAQNVALGFHFDRRIDVGNHRVIRIRALPGPQILHRTAIHQAAPGVLIRHHHDALRIQHLGRLRHEPDAAKRDHVAREIPGLASQFQAIADGIGQLLNLGVLVMMRQNDGLAAALQLGDFFGDGGADNHGGATSLQL